MSTDFLTLPDDVLSHVFGDLDQADRLACLTICKRLHPIAERALYREVVLHSIRQAPVFFEQRQTVFRKRNTDAPGPELIGLQPGSLGRSVPVTVSLKMGVDRHCEPSGK